MEILATVCSAAGHKNVKLKQSQEEQSKYQYTEKENIKQMVISCKPFSVTPLP
jgi:hypothetical protein